jgi:hypothetical protein
LASASRRLRQFMTLRASSTALKAHSTTCTAAQQVRAPHLHQDWPHLHASPLHQLANSLHHPTPLRSSALRAHSVAAAAVARPRSRRCPAPPPPHLRADAGQGLPPGGAFHSAHFVQEHRHHGRVQHHAHGQEAGPVQPTARGGMRADEGGRCELLCCSGMWW